MPVYDLNYAPERYSIVETLIRRDGITRDEAELLVLDAREELRELLEEGNFVEAEDICLTHFGLEPDYLPDLLD